MVSSLPHRIILVLALQLLWMPQVQQLQAQDAEQIIGGILNELFNSNNRNPNPNPNPNIPAVGTTTVTITNNSNSNIELWAYFTNRGHRWMTILPGTQRRTYSYPSGTVVAVKSNGVFSNRITLPAQLTVARDGTLGRGNVRPGPIGATSLTIRNNSNSTVSLEIIPPGGVNPRLGTALIGIPAKDRYTTQGLAVGSQARLSGRVLQRSPQTFNLPANITVFQDGTIGQVSPNPPGPQPGPQPTPRPSPGVGSGNVQVINSSGRSVRIDYTLPVGRSYSYNGRSVTSLWVNLSNGRKDITDDIAANTKITVVGYQEENFVPSGGDLTLTIHSNRITAVSSVSPTPQPDPSPTPSPSPMPNPSPNAPPNPSPIADAPANTVPTVKTDQLSGAVAQALAAKINLESKQLLAKFDQASKKRVATIGVELKTAGASAAAAEEIAAAVIAGKQEKLAALFEMHQLDTNEAAAALRIRLLTAATFRKQFTSLLQKLAAGNSAAELIAEIKAIRDQATNLGAAGLADVMTLTQQDLLIRDTVNSAVVSSVLNVGQSTPPSGSLNVIRHPWVTTAGTFLGTGGVVLTKSPTSAIVVEQASAASLLNLPAAPGTPVAESAATTAAAEIVITNPGANRVTLNYTLDGRRYEIAAGSQQSVSAGRQWTIVFSPQPGADEKRYVLSKAGVYAFVADGSAWDLRQRQYTVTLHNPAKNTAVRYLFNGTESQVAPSANARHESKQPVQIRFDRANSGGTATKSIPSSGDYQFALNPQMQWELYPGKPVASPSGGSGGEKLTINRPSFEDLKATAGTQLFDFANVDDGGGGNSLLDALKKARTPE